jgi:hypothetical protein
MLYFFSMYMESAFKTKVETWMYFNRQNYPRNMFKILLNALFLFYVYGKCIQDQGGNMDVF